MYLPVEGSGGGIAPPTISLCAGEILLTVGGEGAEPAPVFGEEAFGEPPRASAFCSNEYARLPFFGILPKEADTILSCPGDGSGEMCIFA